MKKPKQKKPVPNVQKRTSAFFGKSDSRPFFAPAHNSSAFFRVQTKLSIGQPGDTYERQADQMADQVINANTNTAVQQKCAACEQEEQQNLQAKPFFNTITPLNEGALKPVQKDEPEEREAQASLQRAPEEEEPLQAKSNSAPFPTPVLESRLQSRKGKGEKLPENTRSEMSQAFGADFSQVSVHTDSEAQQMSQSIQAQAFTHGSDIYFNSGKYDTSSSSGKHLLAHELTHTVQQGAVPQLLPKADTADSPQLQREADTSQDTDFEAELAASNRDATDAIDPAPANEARQQAEQSLDVQNPADTQTTDPPPSLPAQSSPSAAPPASAPQDDQQEVAEEDLEQPGPVGQALEEQSANVCDEAGQKASVLAQNEKTHDQAEDKLEQSEAAVVTPAEESQSQSNTEQVDGLDEAQEPEPDKEAAKRKLDQELEQAVPRSIKQMNEFKSKGKAKVVGNAVLGEVNKDVSEVQNTYNAIEQAPEPKPPEPNAELPPVETAPATAQLNLGKEAVPPLAPEHTDFAEFDNQSDELLQKEEITQEQLDMVDSGDLAEANQERSGLKEKVANEPAKIQEFAHNETQQVETDLKQEEREQKKAMKQKRQEGLNKTKEKQGKTKTDLEKKREAVAQKINGIYERAQKSVKTKLDNLEKDSLARFDREQVIASKAFENEVNRKVARWKRRRYSGIFGGAKWLKDKLLGIDDFPEIKQIFVDAKASFVRKIDQLIIDITTDNNKVIEDCKKEIQDAKQEMKDFVGSLEPELQEIGQQSMQQMEDKLKKLDGFIDKKKEELQKKLCDKKEEAIKKIDEKIEAMKEEMSGALAKLGNLLLNAMMKFFKWALEKAGKSPDEIMGIINKGKAVLKKIFTDPIGFIMNLVTGVKQGINNFKNNVKQHLVGGMISWLTGAMGDLPIQLPETWNLKGIISLVLQILGLSWDIIRNKLVRRVGEKVVAAAETSVNIIKRLVTEGPIALWEMIKEKAAEIKTTVMEGIRNWVAVELVKQGILKLVSMLNPAGAIVQAILAIYNTVMFFVENWDRIVDFVKSIFNSIGDIAMGKLSAAAQAIERAMALSIPIMLAFLARFIGLSGIGKAVKKIIMKIRRPIDKVVGKAINFMVKQVKKLFGKGGKKKADDPKKAIKIDKGLKEVEKLEKKKLKNGALTKEDAEAIAKTIKRKHRVFKSFKVIDGQDTWDYIYEASPKKKKRGKKKSVDDLFTDPEIRKKIIDKLPQMRDQLPTPPDGHNWVAVFPAKGRQLKVKVRDKIKPATIGNILGSEKALQFRSVMVQALQNTILRDTGTSAGQHKTTEKGEGFEMRGLQGNAHRDIGKVANKSIKYLMNVELFSIDNTAIPRYLKNARKSKLILHNAKKSVSGALYRKIAKRYKGAYRTKFKGEIHHAIPLYLGGSHMLSNLLKVQGQAAKKAAESAHAALHKFIDELSVTLFFEREGKDPETVTLNNFTVKEIRDKLQGKSKLLFGKLYTNGEIKYKETNIKIDK